MESDERLSNYRNTSFSIPRSLRDAQLRPREHNAQHGKAKLTQLASAVFAKGFQFEVQPKLLVGNLFHQ